MSKNKLFTGLILLFAGLLQRAGAQDPGFRVAGIGSVPIPVTMDKMTNLIFPEAVQIGVKVSSGILAQKVRGVENVIELKAQRQNFAATNLSIYGRDGRLYSFVLHFTADSAVLNFRVLGNGPSAVILEDLPAGVSRLKADAALLERRRGFLHREVRESGVRLRLTGVYLRDSLEWLVIEVGNRTQIPLDIGYTHFSVEDRRRVRRSAAQENGITPVFDGLQGPVLGGRAVRYAVGFKPFTVPRGKRLMVELAGVDGRTVVMGIKSRILLRAKPD